MRFYKQYGIALLMITLLCSACGTPSPDTGTGEPFEHIIIIVLDSLRADHLGAYGYERNTSPFIDSLAGEGVLFERAFSHSAFTRESVSALFQGQFPSRSPWSTGWFARPDPSLKGLPEIFRDAGYVTGLFTTMLAIDAFHHNFDEAEKLVAEWGLSLQAPLLTKRALEFMKKHQDRRTLMYLHFLDPHAPYAPPDEHYLRFAPKRFDSPLHELREVRPNIPELVAEGFGPGDPRFEDMVLRYDAEIAFVDDHLKVFFAELHAMGILDKTLVVFTSDHGEEFLDHGFVEHAWYLYPETLHVPLIFWRPGFLNAQRVETRVSLVDLLPTLLALSELPAPRDDFDGSPLFEREKDQWRPRAEAHPIIAEQLIEMRTSMRAVIKEGYMYLAAPKWLSPAEAAAISNRLTEVRDEFAEGRQTPPDPWGPLEFEALFYLDTDPYAQENIIDEHPDLLARFRAFLDEYRRACPPPIPLKIKAENEHTALSPEQEEQLRALGYLSEEGPSPAVRPVVPAEVEEQLRDLGYL